MSNLDKLRAVLGRAKSGKWEVWTSCSWRRIGVVDDYPEPVVEPMVASDGHPDLRATEETLRAIVTQHNVQSEILAVLEAAHAVSQKELRGWDADMERAAAISRLRHAQAALTAAIEREVPNE